MKKQIVVLLFLFLSVFTTQAMAISFSLSPSTLNITLGDSVNMDLNVSGLTDGAPDSLGAFALNITYDNTVLDFVDVTFGSFLGNLDVDLFETEFFYKNESDTGTLYLDEVSWLSSDELDDLQPDSFTLATLTFAGSGQGSSVIGIENLVVSDALAYSITDSTISNSKIMVTSPVPEPSTMILVGTGILGFAGIRRRK